MAAQPLFATLASAAVLTACATVGDGTVAEPGGAFDSTTVSVEGRSFLATFTPGTIGSALTANGATPVAGTSVRVSADGLGQDEGIIAKKAALAACSDAGGVFQPQAIGRYPAAGVWLFDGACA